MPSKPKRRTQQEGNRSSSKRTKQEDEVPSTIEHLLQKMRDKEHEIVWKQQAQDKGYRHSLVWPALRQAYAQSTSTTATTTATWIDLCNLYGILLSFECRESSPHPTAVIELTRTRADMDCTTAWLNTLCRHKDVPKNQQPVDYYASLTMVVHVLDILLSALPEPHVPTILLTHLGGPRLFRWLPSRRQDLERRRGKLLPSSSSSPTTLSTASKPLLQENPTTTQNEQPPILLDLINTLVESLAGTSVKPPNDTEHENEDEDNDNNMKTLVENGTTPFVHQCLALLIDVLSVWETRHYLVPYLEATHFLLKCRRAAALCWNKDPLVQQLLETVSMYMHFPLDLYTGEPHTQATRWALYHARAATLQKMAHRYYPDTLPDVIYAGIGILCSDPKFLRRSVAGITDEALHDLLYKMRLVQQEPPSLSEESPCYDRQFLLDILQEYLVVPPDPVEELRHSPLYPTESVLWDVHRIPPSRSRRGRRCKDDASNNQVLVLALPKLQRSFLSLADYLLRNFTLTRLETAYGIRTDLVDVIRRLNPVARHVMNQDEENPQAVLLQTEFSGWARMALELETPVEIIKVEKPLLGSNAPASVQATVKVNLKSCADSLRREWDSLTEFDNLFLVTINAAKMTGTSPTEVDSHSKSNNVDDDDDPTFPQRYGVTHVRGCMITHVLDEEDKVISDPGGVDVSPKGTRRSFRVLLDPNQFAMDAKSAQGTDLYESFNLIVRRHGRENNFRAILETTRGLLSGSASIARVLPPWLQPLLLGHGNPSNASYKSDTVREYAKKTVGVADPDSFLDFGDTFVDEKHLYESFPGAQITVDGKILDDTNVQLARRNFKVRVDESGPKTHVEAKSYDFPGKGNTIEFTAVQVEAIRSGLSCGLTTIVGPPGTGKTDCAVQVIACLYHTYPTQRTVVITHSNAALNDIFSKVMARGDVDERYMVRLGAGERELETDSTHDFTKTGRVAYSLQRRAELLEQVQQISESLGLSGRAERGPDGSPSYTCETAAIFYENQIKRKLRLFRDEAKEKGLTESDSDVSELFPFVNYFRDSLPINWGLSIKLVNRFESIFDELAEYRPLELLRSQRQKTDYLLIKQARVVAMTCTHAAIARTHLLSLGFEYDNIVIEESAQMTEIDTIIPFLLQKSESDTSNVGVSRLKRVCLLGDHHQLPPVIRNQTFARYSNLDQSFFTRLIHFGVPHIQLDRQGRARSDLARLYSWRYKELGNLAHIDSLPSFQAANPGFAHTFQFVQVDAYQGKGEYTPTAFYYQNLGEAEYAVALFQYMVLIGYEPSRISILATYNGQKELIRDILSQRCGLDTPLEGIRPAAVSTVDQYQGQQNDYVILSLVRTEALGHLRDIRRWVVALSRARLGLYVLGRAELFQDVHDLQPIVQVWNERPHVLELVLGETMPTERQKQDLVPQDQLFRVESVEQLGAMVVQLQEQLLEQVDQTVAEE